MKLNNSRTRDSDLPCWMSATEFKRDSILLLEMGRWLKEALQRPCVTSSLREAKQESCALPLEATAGQGVDVVLNSLSGEA